MPRRQRQRSFARRRSRARPCRRREALIAYTARITSIFFISAIARAGLRPFGTGARAVHDGVAAVEPEGIFELVETLARVLVARVDNPPVGLEQDRGTEEAFRVPPVARASGRTAGAEYALIESVQVGALFSGLCPLPIRRRRGPGAHPRFDRDVLGIEVGEIGHQILDDRQVGERVDLHALPAFVDGAGAGERVRAVDVHRAGTADSLPARATEGQRGVCLVLDLDEGVENHRSAGVEIHFVGVESRVRPEIRVVAVHLETLDAPALAGVWVRAAACRPSNVQAG